MSADKHLSIRDRFDRVSAHVTRAVGSPPAIGLAAAVILVWAISGPIFHFSDTWQLAINTGTTIVTFLMVFVIQATQNRESAALHLKLDEVIRSMKGARNEFITVEEATEEELKVREREMAQVAERVAREAGHPDAARAARDAAASAAHDSARRPSTNSGHKKG